MSPTLIDRGAGGGEYIYEVQNKRFWLPNWSLANGPSSESLFHQRFSILQKYCWMFLLVHVFIKVLSKYQIPY